MREPLTAEEIIEIVTSPAGRVFLVGMARRIGVGALFAAIEWNWYAPDTTRSRFFDVYLTEWQGIDHIIAAFPAGRLDAVQRLARRLGLRIANGVPTLLTVGPSGLAPHYFPGGLLANGKDNLAMFTVENDTGSPVYKNRSRDNAGMLQATDEINETLNRGVRLTPAQIADYIYGPGFPRNG